MILIDTNVISELVRPAPAAPVVACFRRHAPGDIATAAICEAEVQYGLARMAAGRRRDELAARVAEFFAQALLGQVFPFDRHCAGAYGMFRSEREASGAPVSVEDAMIAATARAHGASAVMTRNVADFIGCGVPVIDPWAG